MNKFLISGYVIENSKVFTSKNGVDFAVIKLGVKHPWKKDKKGFKESTVMKFISFKDYTVNFLADNEVVKGSQILLEGYIEQQPDNVEFENEKGEIETEYHTKTTFNFETITFLTNPNKEKKQSKAEPKKRATKRTTKKKVDMSNDTESIWELDL